MDKLTARQEQFSNALADKNRMAIFNNIQASYNVYCVSTIMFNHFYNSTNSKEEFQNIVKHFVGNFKNAMGFEFDKDLEVHQKLLKDGQKVHEIKPEDARGIYDILMKECLEPRMDNFMRQFDVHDAIQKDKIKKAEEEAEEAEEAEEKK